MVLFRKRTKLCLLLGVFTATPTANQSMTKRRKIPRNRSEPRNKSLPSRTRRSVRTRTQTRAPLAPLPQAQPPLPQLEAPNPRPPTSPPAQPELRTPLVTLPAPSREPNLAISRVDASSDSFCLILNKIAIMILYFYHCKFHF